MPKFYQLTDSILVEYLTYNEVPDEVLSIDYPNIKGNFLVNTGILVINDNYTKNRYLLTDNFQKTFEEMTTNSCKTNTVFPIKENGSKFINPRFSDDGRPSYLDIDNKFEQQIYPGSEKIYYDTVIIHFTKSGLNFDMYKSYIFEIMNTVGYSNSTVLASVIFNADTRYIMDSQPQVINGKLYVKKFAIRIPSISYLNKSAVSNNIIGASLKDVFDYDISNSYNKISLIGISNIVLNNTFLYYDTEYLCSTNIINNTDDDISLQIRESYEGEFFEIKTLANDGTIQLSDFFKSKQDSFQIEYNIRLVEHYWDETQTQYDIFEAETDRIYVSREYDIASEDEYQECNEPITYRPVLKKHNVVSFDIIVSLNITSLSDNNILSYYGELSYGLEESEYVSQYGKRIKPYISGSSNLLKINVYNKRQKSDEMMPVIKNSSVTSINKKASTIEVTSFIESTNIKVGVSDVSVSDITINE